MECSVCYEFTQEKIACGHSLCNLCHKNWLKNHETCPCCRKTIASYANNPLIRELYFLTGGKLQSIIK